MSNDTRILQFNNLIDQKTGNRLNLEVPIGWMGMGNMIYVGICAEQTAEHLRKILSCPDPDNLL